MDDLKLTKEEKGNKFYNFILPGLKDCLLKKFAFLLFLINQRNFFLARTTSRTAKITTSLDNAEMCGHRRIVGRAASCATVRRRQIKENMYF